MVIDEFLQALGVESLPTDFQSLDASVVQNSTALLDVASLCAGLSDALNQAQQSVSFFGTQTVTLATLMQQAAESGISTLQNEPIQTVLAQVQPGASGTSTLAATPASPSLFTSASAAFGDLDDQSVRLAQSWQAFLQNQDVGAFAQSLSDIGSAVAGDADQLTSAKQEVMDFFNSINDGIAFFEELQTVITAVGEAEGFAATMGELMALPFTAIAAAIVAVGAALVYAYQQYQAFKQGATDGLLYDVFTGFSELLVSISGLWRYVMDEAIESLLKIKSNLPGFAGGGLSDEEQVRLTQLQKQTAKGLSGYQNTAVTQYKNERHAIEAKAREQKAKTPAPQPAPALSALLPSPNALSNIPAHGALTHRSPMAAASVGPSGVEPSGSTQFYIDTLNVTADSPAELASSVAQEADVVHSRHVSTMLNYSRGKGVRP
jgi:hypothetical protein